MPPLFLAFNLRNENLIELVQGHNLHMIAFSLNTLEYSIVLYATNMDGVGDSKIILAHSED